MSDYSNSQELSQNEINVSFKDIKPNMVLSRDVVTEDGKVLLGKDTMINNINFTKLKAFGIREIFVKIKSTDSKLENFDEEINTIERQSIPVESREEFREFITVYEDKKEKVKKAIHAISDGQSVDLEQLYSLTDDVMKKLKCKSDIFTFIGFIKDYSEHTFTHSSNVALLSNLFGHWLDLDETNMINLTAAGILHDIGKTKTPPGILNKRGRLSDEEFKIMKMHTVDGYRILQPQDIPNEIKLTALMHHERIDGSGYPLGIKAEKIDKLSKMVSIVDIYDAMTANRVYRGKICPFEVIRTFETKVYGELDTEFLWMFLRNIAYTYLGTWVILSDGSIGEVVFINQNNLSKPIVKVDDGRILDLAYEKELKIVSVV